MSIEKNSIWEQQKQGEQCFTLHNFQSAWDKDCGD